MMEQNNRFGTQQLVLICLKKYNFKRGMTSRDISRKTGLGMGNVQRMLMRLNQFHFIRVNDKQRIRRYWIRRR